MDSIRLAIVGCGRAYQLDYRPALVRLGWRPAVYVDRDLAPAQRAVGSSAAEVAADVDSVIDGFDAAIVTTDQAERAELCGRLADAGKHLLVPPPISATVEEAERIYSAAQSIIFDCGHFRFSKAACWIKSLLDDGQLGEILDFSAVAGKAYTARGRATFDRGEGGVFTDHGTAIADVLTWWLGALTVESFGDDALGGEAAESVATLRTSKGASGRIELSRVRPLQNAITIRGQQGWVELDLLRFSVRAHSKSVLGRRYGALSARESRDRSERRLYFEQLRDWRAAIGAGRQKADSGGAIQTISLANSCRQMRRPLEHSWVRPRNGAANHAAHVSSQLKDRRVLVTGATGFIGTRLVEKLATECGARVTALARHPGRAARLARLDIKIRQADLNDPSNLDPVLADQDIVFNLAYDFKRAAAENVAAFQNLAEASGDYDVKRLVQVSSIAVYDDWPIGDLTEASPREKSGSDYKNAKMQMDRELLSHSAFSSAIVQPTIVYGPYSWLWTDLKIEQLLSGRVILPDEGQGHCPAVYVDDVADALILAAAADIKSGESFIVSGEEPVSWRNFYRAYEQALGIKALEFVDASKLSHPEQGGGKLNTLAANPLAIANWTPVRYVLNKIEQTMGDQAIDDLRAKVVALRGSAGPSVHYPSASDLILLQSKGRCSIDKATREIGYRPAFSFADGAKVTSDYVRWRYIDSDKPV